MKYRKKPVIIEAFRIGIDSWPDWFTDKVSDSTIITHKVEQDLSPFFHTKIYCEINTLEGKMTGDYGDYIIRGINGEIYPCKPDIFLKTYDKVE